MFLNRVIDVLLQITILYNVKPVMVEINYDTYTHSGVFFFIVV